MARYLTPSKIGLLALMTIYTEGVVPTSKTTSVLSFLLSHVLSDISHSATVPSAGYDHAVPIAVFEAALSTHASAIPGRTIWDLFLKKLWSFDCSDALDQFITNTASLLIKSRDQLLKERESVGEVDPGPGRISRASPFGAFIRRAHLEFTRLQFHDAILLWQRFLTYRLPTRQMWERKNVSAGRSALDVNLSDFQIDTSHPLAQIMYGGLVAEDIEDDGGFSTHDKERLMEFHVSELQSTSYEVSVP